MSETVTVTALDISSSTWGDVERSLRFYLDDLELVPVRVDEWRRHEAPFASVRVDRTPIIDLVQLPRSGENVDHVCLVVERLDFDALKANLSRVGGSPRTSRRRGGTGHLNEGGGRRRRRSGQRPSRRPRRMRDGRAGAGG